MSVPSERSSFEVIANALDVLRDPRVGVIRHVAEEPVRDEFPRIFQYVAETCDTSAFSPRQAFGQTGGCSIDREVALAKAVGEAVERYAAALYDDDALPDVSFSQADFPCIPPEGFALNSRAQYATADFDWEPFTRDTRTRWVEAVDLVTGESVWVPGPMVYVPYFYYLESEDPMICQPISTGLACHSSWLDAVISGLCEVIERDAFMITWQAGLSRARLDPGTLSQINRDLIERIESTGARVTLFDVTMDSGVPSIMAVQRHAAPEMPALTFSCATSLSPERAVRKALEEVTHTARWMFYLKRDYPPLYPKGGGFDHIVDQNTHLVFWAQHDNAHLADFVFAGKQEKSFTDLQDYSTGEAAGDLQVLTRLVNDTGHRALAVDITPEEIRPLGLHVARSLIPGYHPLIMNHRFRALGSERLWKVPKALGLGGVDRESGDIDLPHPFP